MKQSAIVFVSILLAVAVLVSCSPTEAVPTATSSPVATPVPTPTPTPNPITADQILAQAAQALTGLKTASFGLGITLTGQLPVGNQVQIDAAGQVAFPDRLKQAMTITVSVVSVKTEVVFITDTVYVKNPATGQWQQYKTDQFNGAIFQPGKLVAMISSGLKSVVRLNDDVIDGVGTYHIQGTLDPAALPLEGRNIPKDSLRNIRADLWVDRDTFMVHQIALKLDGTLPDGGNVAVGATLTLSQINQPVAIQPPV